MENKNLKKILLVDDDSDWLSYLSDLLYHPSYPYIIRTARSGEEALNRLDNVSLVISDIQMPLMNGCELLKKIKEVKPDVPVILHSSGYNWEVNPDRQVRLGVAGFLQKDEMDERLFPLVVKLLGEES